MQIAYLVVLYALASTHVWLVVSQHKYTSAYVAGFGLMYLLGIPLIVYRKAGRRWGLVFPMIWLVITGLIGFLVLSEPAPEGVVLALAAACNGVSGLYEHVSGQGQNKG